MHVLTFISFAAINVHFYTVNVHYKLLNDARESAKWWKAWERHDNYRLNSKQIWWCENNKIGHPGNKAEQYQTKMK